MSTKSNHGGRGRKTRDKSYSGMMSFYQGGIAKTSKRKKMKEALKNYESTGSDM